MHTPLRILPRCLSRLSWLSRSPALLACALAFMLPLRTRAAIEFWSPASNLGFELQNVPAAFRQGDFSLLMWVWIEPPDAPKGRMICSIKDRFELKLGSDGRLAASLIRSAPPVQVEPPGRSQRYSRAVPLPWDQTPPGPTGAQAGSSQSASAGVQRLTATTSGPVQTGVWTLVAVTLDRHTGRLSVYARSDDAAPKIGGVTGADWTPFHFASADHLMLGASAAPVTSEAMMGSIALVVIRSEVVTAADLDAVYASRRLLAPLDTDRRSLGGVISGPDRALWMIGHSMPTFPYGGSGGSTFERSAVVGRPVKKTNVTIYSDLYGLTPLWNVTGPVLVVTDATHQSPHDGRYAGFFVRDRWNSGIGPGWTKGIAASAGELLSATPTRQIRVIASSNSRGVKTGDGSGLSPGNYAHGFIEKYLPQVSGVLLRPATLTSGGNPWFGFNCSFQNPAQSAPGTILDIAATTDNAGDFGRFFTGSAAFGRGPGAGVFMLPGSTYAMRCASEWQSLMNADGPLDVEAHLLSFPGATNMQWRSDRGSNQQGNGVVGPWQPLTLDSTRITLAPDPIIFQTQTILAFLGDQRNHIQIGDACVVADGPGKRSISLVQSLNFDGLRTRVTLEKPLLAAPTGDSIVKFGPWQLVSVLHSFPALAYSDVGTWRGLAFQAEQGGIGAPVYAFSAVRPDVPGFVFGTAGWGGHGYQLQMDRSFPAANIAWMALTRADVWFQVPAQQLSLPSCMPAFSSLVKAALPDCDIIWAGESGLFADPGFGWHQYILENAASNNAIGLSLLEHPRVGNFREQYADGMLSDNDHYSQRGNRRLADLWIAQLRQALRAGCPGDYDQSGSIDASDLAAFEADLSAENPAADVNADGLVNSDDLTTFLSDYAQGC